MRVALILLITSALLAPARADATYSIAAVDQATGEVGGAGASCVRSNVIRILGPVPGHGVVQAQSYFLERGRDRAAQLLLADTPPADIIAEITAPAFDVDAARRQYGVVDLMGRVAAYTGATNGTWAGDRNGRSGSFVYTVQGNLLTGPDVVNRAALAFEDGGGCDLAERLLLAMEAGAANGEGDRRCTPNAIPADSAFLHVDPIGGTAGTYLRFTVDLATTTSPLVGLRQQLDTWRRTHPCPPPPSLDATVMDGSIALDAEAGAMDATIADASAADAGAASELTKSCGCRTARAKLGRDLLGPALSAAAGLGLLGRRRRR